jgi:hypothetical protein
MVAVSRIQMVQQINRLGFSEEYRPRYETPYPHDSVITEHMWYLRKSLRRLFDTNCSVEDDDLLAVVKYVYWAYHMEKLFRGTEDVPGEMFMSIVEKTRTYMRSGVTTLKQRRLAVDICKQLQSGPLASEYQQNLTAVCQSRSDASINAHRSFVQLVRRLVIDIAEQHGFKVVNSCLFHLDEWYPGQK